MTRPSIDQLRRPLAGPRPAPTRAELRASMWRFLLYADPDPYCDPAEVLEILGALDAEEAGDAAGGRVVDRWISRLVIDTCRDGCHWWLRRRKESEA